MPRFATAAALLIAALPACGSARGIERYANSGPGGAIILQSVGVPAGAEMLYLSGQVATPIDPRKAPSGEPAIADYGDTRTQTVSALNKIKTIIESHGFTMGDVIKLTVFVAGDPAQGGKMDFAGVNAGFKGFFGTPANPVTVARSTVQVAALASPAFLVEIEATAARVPGAERTAAPRKDMGAGSESAKPEPAKAAPEKTATPKKSPTTH
jgi:2-iminobutanoate/2-iminopropanoate deaminase